MEEGRSLPEQSGIVHSKCPKKGSRFKNPHIKDIKRGLWDYFLWAMGKFKEKEFIKLVPSNFSYPNPKLLDLGKPSVMWVNHSTFLISYKGVKIVTDPILSERCSPFSFFGPKRLHKPPFEIEALEDLSLVLISHDHYDHLDKVSIEKIYRKNPNVLFIVPEGVKKWFTRRGIENVRELSWWENTSVSFGKVNLEVTSVPSQHFSGRSLFSTNKTLWCGFVVKISENAESCKKMYFVGDTGYNPNDFKSIGDVFKGFDLSLIPIGTYVPYAFMSPVHICPEKAVKIHQEVHSKLSIGMHWKTFKLSEENLDQPPFDLHSNMEKANLNPLAFRVLEPGQKINW